MAWEKFEDWCYRLAVTETQGFRLLRDQPDVEDVELTQITENALSETFAKHLCDVITRIERSYRPAGPVELVYSMRDPSEPAGESASSKNREFGDPRSALEYALELDTAGKLHSGSINTGAENPIWNWGWNEIQDGLGRARAAARSPAGSAPASPVPEATCRN